jgi:hypothetical protein
MESQSHAWLEKVDPVIKEEKDREEIIGAKSRLEEFRNGHDIIALLQKSSGLIINLMPCLNFYLNQHMKFL